MCDRTYGALRKWAICRPKQMLDWIESLKDENVKDALRSLWKNAEGLPDAATREQKTPPSS